MTAQIIIGLVLLLLTLQCVRIKRRLHSGYELIFWLTAIGTIPAAVHIFELPSQIHLLCAMLTGICIYMIFFANVAFAQLGKRAQIREALYCAYLLSVATGIGIADKRINSVGVTLIVVPGIALAGMYILGYSRAAKRTNP